MRESEPYIDPQNPPDIGQMTRALPPGYTKEVPGNHTASLLRSRLSVVENVYHQCPNEQPLLIASNYMRWLDTDEQPFVRRLTTSEKWTELDYGWLPATGVGLVVIQNLEKPSINSLSAQRRVTTEIENVIEVAVTNDQLSPPSPTIILYPGESCRFLPSPEMTIRVRCRSGKSKVTISIIPK